MVPIIDNFYLDMNGIIHNCTHGNNPDVKLTEDEMIVRIFGYLDKLFHIVKPQKVMFMAIDGVAPRAKMNQQRARRFKAAKEAEEAALAAERRGEPLPDAASRFDSNCITPGTPFMARLGAHLRFFIRKKIAEDPAWRKPTIIFSGHDVPGEGEHKIMEYIRWAKRDPAYAPNTRHCLYGLDADLIMLSLVTHEPHFCLLREVVSYTGGNRGQPAREVLENPCQEHFVLLQIGYVGAAHFELRCQAMETNAATCCPHRNSFFFFFLPLLPLVPLGSQLPSHLYFFSCSGCCATTSTWSSGPSPTSCLFNTTWSALSMTLCCLECWSAMISFPPCLPATSPKAPWTSCSMPTAAYSPRWAVTSLSLASCTGAGWRSF